MTSNELKTDRRRLLAGAGARAAAVVLAACGKQKPSTPPTPSTTTIAQSQRDITMLRTMSSLAELQVSIYKRAVDGGLLKTAGLADTVGVILAQHKAHAALLEGETTKAGGQPFTQPNPLLSQQYKARIDGMSDEGSFLRLAYDLANQASATYLAALTNVDDDNLNVVLMSIGGVNARHAAVFGPMIGQSVGANSFATAAGAVAPGTGV